MDSRTSRHMTAALLALLLATPVLAVDGVIEINQAKVAAGGVTPNDSPGYPVTIDQPGSYRLTGDLTVPAGVDGISVQADNITIDLNGFTLFGGGGLTADGISVGAQKNIEIRNGTIRGFSRAGIFGGLFSTFARAIDVRALSNGFQGIELQGPGSLVNRCTAASNGTTGLRVGDGGLITQSVARSNTSFGMTVSATAAYGGNVLTGNNGGDANAQMAGTGIPIATNVCGSDTICP